MKAFRCVVPLAVLAFVACGPKPEPEPPKPEGPTPEELAQQKALAEAPYQETVQKFNTAIWELKPDLLHESLTKATYDLFMQRAAKEAMLRGLEEPVDDMGFLKQQQDYKIVYSIKSIDVETDHAVVVGTIEGEVQWESEINFVEEDGLLKIDHSVVLEKAIVSLDEAIEKKKAREEGIREKVESLIADHNTALADKNPEMLEGTISAESAELAVKFLGLLPKKEGGVKKPSMEAWVAFKAGKVSKVEVKSIDFDDLTVTLIHHPVVPKKMKKGEQAPAPFEKIVDLVEENGRYVLDCSEELQAKIDALGAPESGKKEKKAEPAEDEDE